MKVVILGVFGWIGSYLVVEVKMCGYEVVVVVCDLVKVIFKGVVV